ncbi:MAG: hypothetical protein FWD65_06255 [Coriobacteriia bacterium]|nr:hypothetical protein [Coriobacteriia bacterium]
MAMSTFSIIELIALAIIVIGGTILKIIFIIQRKKLEGFHGYVHKDEPDPTITDTWQSL